MHCKYCLYFFHSVFHRVFRRVGLAHATETTNILIPSNIDAIWGQFDTVEPEKTAPEWDFIWNTLIEEGREKKMKGLALARCTEFVPGRASVSDELVLAEGALKVCLVST